MQIHVSPATAFRWRHTILAAARRYDGEAVAGWIELEWAWFVYSEKGRRRPDGTARRRGVTPNHRLSEPGTTVAIACDRRQRVVTGAINERPATGRRLDSGRLAKLLAPRLCAPVVFIARHGQLGPAAVMARRMGASFRDARSAQSATRLARSIVHVRHALAYRDRLLAWMPRFRGVATRYLPNYLLWHRAVDRRERAAFRLDMLRWPIDCRFG
ncbi:MAG: hypothetical protein L0271_20760 [Gemmatimonadetes bacterium]|nr:hypothetical protein [Gemmatimonadota bacterium]